MSFIPLLAPCCTLLISHHNPCDWLKFHPILCVEWVWANVHKYLRRLPALIPLPLIDALLSMIDKPSVAYYRDLPPFPVDAAVLSDNPDPIGHCQCIPLRIDSSTYWLLFPVEQPHVCIWLKLSSFPSVRSKHSPIWHYISHPPCQVVQGNIP